MENRFPTEEEEQTVDVRSQIYADQVKQLFDNAPLGMAATLINAPALIYILWNVVPHGALASDHSAVRSFTSCSRLSW